MELKGQGYSVIRDVVLQRNTSHFLPILQNDYEEMDDVRADIIAQNFEDRFLQLETCPYKTKEYGDCQLCIVLKP